ncbi:MAG: hypothetical protein ACQEXJ_01415 [Myxococcota bacterium]
MPIRTARCAGLFLAALLLGGCPDPSSSDTDVTGPSGADADAAADVGAEDTTPEPDLPAGQCTSDEECIPRGALPACRVPSCVDGACALVADEDDTPCDDGDACTTGDRCVEGACVGEALSCDDDNPCTTDACDPAGGCVHTFNQKSCDDGDACTVQDHCFQGACVGEALSCDDGNPCTDDLCDPVDGCSWGDREGPCEDGDACTDGDQCVDGACVPGGPTDCGEGNPCVDATCDPVEGCQVSIVDGDCDDGDACTTDDHCEDGVCTGDLVACDDGNPCTSDYCDPAAGCQFTNHEAACDDGDPCTLEDACSEGVCVPGEPDPLCCDEASGCDDGDPCTTDACVDGYCDFAPLDCSDGFDCTADSCVAGECLHEPYGPLPTGTVVSTGFEEATALDAWTVESDNADVTWQLDVSEAHTGERSLYCGSIPDYTYDHGATVARVTRTLDVPIGSATLSLHVMADLVEANCSYDVVRLRVDGQTLQPEICDSEPEWAPRSWDLTPWAGDIVELEILFETGDGVLNGGQGVWVDDLEVVADNPSGCCLADDDCPPHPSDDCAVATCDDGTCGYDTTACPQ